MMAVGSPIPVPRIARGAPGFDAAVDAAHAALVEALEALYHKCVHWALGSTQQYNVGRAAQRSALLCLWCACGGDAPRACHACC